MKRTILLLLLAAVTTAAGPTSQTVSRWHQSQTLTQAAPSTSSTDGIPLAGVTGWRLVVCAPAAQAITGGAMLVWVQDTDGLWADTPRLAAVLVFSSTGQRCQSLGEFPVAVPGDRLYPTTSSVTLSGAGTTVDVRVRYTQS